MRGIIAVGVAACMILLIIGIPADVMGWGFWAHKEINRYAIRSLPAEMKGFFEAHAEAIVARAVEPDQRRYRDKSEGSTHYIDIDRYGTSPFESLPRDHERAVEKFGNATVDSNGTVPWRILEFTRKLTDAMKRKDTSAIVFYASNLGHYVADAHVPLHATENYDGQLTDQKGIHARWESEVPERYGKGFAFHEQEATYIGNQLDLAFAVVLESFARVDSVLTLDRKAKESLPEGERFKVVKRKDRIEYQYSDRYYEEYYRLLNGMVEERMNDSIRRVASFWYTAWVDAGKPELKRESP